MKIFYVGMLGIILVACTRVPSIDKDEIPLAIEQRIGIDVSSHQERPYEQIDSWLTCLLAHELTPESAMQIAVMNSPRIQAILAEQGIAHADLIEAGLLSNPDFSLELRYPQKKGFITNIEYMLTAALLDLFLRPLRMHVAAAEYEQVKRRITNEILALAFEVRQAYYELVAEHQKIKYTQSLFDLSQINYELALSQQMVGNTDLLSRQQARAKLLDVELQLAKEKSSVIRLKEKFMKLLGLNADACFILADISEQVDYRGFDLCSLESIAWHYRMDVQQAAFEIIRLQRMLRLKNGWAYTNFRAGLAGEREPEGLNLLGVGLSAEIPIFNFGQAARLRLFAQLRQAQEHYHNLHITVLSEVREAHQLLMSQLKMVENYQTYIIPLHKEISISSEELYNIMGLGIHTLLENKRQELQAQHGYLEVLKDYWLARVQLDRALGGCLFRLLAQAACQNANTGVGQ